MAIPESQLEAWSRQGSVTQSSGTYLAVRSALMSSRADYAAQSFDVFLQGSYANDTNIQGETDVDAVIRLNTIFAYDLSLTLAILEKRSSGQLNTTSSKTPVSSAAR